MGIRGNKWQFGRGPVPDVDAVVIRAVSESDGGRHRGAFVSKAFSAGDSICKDHPLPGASFHLPSNQQRVVACGYCYRYVGSVQLQLAQLSGGSGRCPEILPGMAVQDDGFLSRIVPSNIGCGVKYCSQECASKAWQSLDYDDFIAHAKSENEAFVMAGRMITHLIGLPGIEARKELLSQYLRLCAAPWWELVVIPDDVPEKKHLSYRRKLKATAARSLCLLKEVLVGSGRTELPEDLSYILDLDFYGMLVGAILQNSICIELPNPARQYLEAQISLGEDNTSLQQLKPIAQAILQHQAQLEAKELEDGTMSLSEDENDGDGSYCSSDVSSDSGSSSDGENGTAHTAEDLPMMPLLITAAESIQDLEASGIFPVISFLNHSCEPNVSVEFTGENGLVAEIVAIRDINEGEELCISYIENDLLESAEERQKELREYNFTCRCPRCTPAVVADAKGKNAINLAGSDDDQHTSHRKRPASPPLDSSNAKVSCRLQD